MRHQVPQRCIGRMGDNLSWECWRSVTCRHLVKNVAKFGSKCVSGLTQKFPRQRFLCQGLPTLYPIQGMYGMVCTHTDPPPTTHNPNPAAPLLRCSPATARPILPLLLLCARSSSGRMGVTAAGEQWGSGGKLAAAAIAVLDCCCCLDAVLLSLSPSPLQLPSSLPWDGVVSQGIPHSHPLLQSCLSPPLPLLLMKTAIAGVNNNHYNHRRQPPSPPPLSTAVTGPQS